MRKSLIPAVIAALALGGAAGCAHPHEAPLPGESRTPTATTAATGADETKAVCSEAMSASTTAVASLRVKLTEAKAALDAKNQAGALTAANAASVIAKDWSSKLSTLVARPIKPDVRTVLADGITMINSLVAAGPNLNPTDAESKLTSFTTKLASACAGA